MSFYLRIFNKHSQKIDGNVYLNNINSFES